MKIYQVHPLTAAIFLSVLCMGMVGIFVVVPIAAIEWTWNSLANVVALLPSINIWQASLLYLAGATILYLLGFVRFDVEASGMEP